ncbi:alpha/beta hydrolase [Paenibacillus silviterrae]|uniref:alpha/beta hydrolase n=1 Tax=Paenibacillus silviterrae TaxID=3242194 RepID=UPI002543E1C7|nr:alpha/beta hydrolase-fold protein [Paenibacillus chinjuensis]
MAWLKINYYSEALRLPVAMDVLLPEQGSGAYETLYLLHDMGDGHSAWLRRSGVERYAERLPLAVIMPAGHLGWYTNMAFGRDYFRFITEELPALCERTFPLAAHRDGRYIAGAGAGGYGAVKAGLLASSTFAAAGSFSGTLDVLAAYDSMDPRHAMDVFGERELAAGSTNDLNAAVKRIAESDKPKTEMYVSCSIESPNYNNNEKFCKLMKELEQPFIFRTDHGKGNWADWDKELEQFVTWLSERKQRSE